MLVTRRILLLFNITYYYELLDVRSVYPKKYRGRQVLILDYNTCAAYVQGMTVIHAKHVSTEVNKAISLIKLHREFLTIVGVSERCGFDAW